MSLSESNRARRPFSPEDFAALVTPLLKPMTNLARGVLRSDDLAWDAVQEALLSLWLETDLPPNPRAWLFRTVLNRCLHLSRTRARRRKHEGLACRIRPEASDRDDPERKRQREELAGCVYGAFTRISPEQRDVLVLRAVEEKDYETIAQSLQIPLGTVRSRLSRSRRVISALLRPLLEDGDDEDQHRKG